MTFPAEPGPLTLAEAVGDYRSHRQHAENKVLDAGDTEAAAVHATLAAAAATLAAAFITSGKLDAPTQEWS